MGKTKPQTKARLKRNSPAVKRISLEDSVVAMALSGKLRGAARSAIRRQKSKGLKVTFQRGNKIVQQSIDGNETELGTVKSIAYRLPPGVRIFGRE